MSSPEMLCTWLGKAVLRRLLRARHRMPASAVRLLHARSARPHSAPQHGCMLAPCMPAVRPLPPLHTHHACAASLGLCLQVCWWEPG